MKVSKSKTLIALGERGQELNATIKDLTAELEDIKARLRAHGEGDYGPASVRAGTRLYWKGLPFKQDDLIEKELSRRGLKPADYKVTTQDVVSFKK